LLPISLHIAKTTVKRLLIILVAVFPLHNSFGQTLSPYYKNKAADRVKQVLKDFESAFGVLTNPYIVDREERDGANYRMHATLHPDARFQNDLVPGNKGAKTIDFEEYKRIALISYQKGGLTYHIDWTEAEFKSIPDGYLALFYGKKSLFGDYQGQKRLQLESVPCRAGVFLKMDGSQVTGARIAFMDTDLKEKGKNLISLTDRTNPLELITLPEVIDKLSEQVIRSMPKTGARKLFIEEITFQALGISNDFSKQLTGTLKSSLTRMDSSIQIDLSITRGFGSLLKLKGSYHKSGNFLKIGVRLFDDRDLPVSSELFAEILLSNLPNVEIEPVEYLVDEALRMQAILDRGGDGQPVAHVGDLQLEINTDKGYGPQLYREGDIMTLKIRANKPCTVRMLYQDAAKNILRLRNDDFTITADAVGKWIDIPEKFECAAPFGFEMLIAYATRGKFKAIGKTKSQNGFTFILDDLKNVVELTTGNNKTGEVAKCTIPITTQPRRKVF
jgi:hypothetical protein